MLIRSPSPQAPASFNATIKHLRAFLAVATRRNFTRAASDLHLSQPALTMAIRQLEDIVGASLFNRTTRTVSLTPEGSDLLPIAERLVIDFDIAIQDVQHAASARRRRLGVAVVHSIATKIVPQVLPDFMRSNPGVRIQLRDGNSSEVRRQVRMSEVDFGFCSKDEDDAELDFEPLFRDRMGLLMPRGHPLARTHRPLKWRDLDSHDFIGLTRDTATAPLLGQVTDLPQSLREPRYEVSMNSTMWALLESGIGVTLAPALSVFGSTEASLVFRPLTRPDLWRTVFIVTRRGRTTPQTAAVFMRLTRERISAIAATSDLITVAGLVR